MTAPPLDALGNAPCPGCATPGSLRRDSSVLAARICGACGGWFFQRDAAYRFFVEELGTPAARIGELLAAPGARRRRCASCAAETSAIRLGGEEVDLCSGCGGAWLAPGIKERLARGSQGAAPAAASPFGAPPSPFGPPPAPSEAPGFAPAPVSGLSSEPPEAPPPPKPRAVRVGRAARAAPAPARAPLGTSGAVPVASGHKGPLLIVGLAGAALLLVVLGAFALWPSDEAPAARRAEEGGDLSARYGAYLRHYHFGGRPVDWWGERLSELGPGGAKENERLYGVTKQRAERLGLVVDEQPGRVEVRLSDPLAARLLERLEVD